MKKLLLLLPFVACFTAFSASAADMQNTSPLSDSTQNVSFSVFPNPTDGVIHIKSSLTIHHFTITDLSGSVILEASQMGNQLDLSSLAAGTYVLLPKLAVGRTHCLYK